MRLWALLVLAAGLVFGQLGPKFEVVSIKPNEPGKMNLTDPDQPAVLPGGVYRDPAAMPAFLISFAYGIPDASFSLSGLPDWAQKASYSVLAKAGDGYPQLSPAENRERVRLMVRAMLEERFRFKLRSETRPGPVMRLQVDKREMLPKEASAPAGAAETVRRVSMSAGDSGGRIIGPKVKMSALAAALEVFFKQPVLDETGLAGYYEFDVRYAATFADGSRASSGLGPEGLSAIEDALRDRLGLTLRKGTGQRRYWVVERIERPEPE